MFVAGRGPLQPALQTSAAAGGGRGARDFRGKVMGILGILWFP